jgi:hypothetical protein
MLLIGLIFALVVTQLGEVDLSVVPGWLWVVAGAAAFYHDIKS